MTKRQKTILIVVGILTGIIAIVFGFGIFAAYQARNAADRMYQAVDHDGNTVNTAAADPFSILLLGIDSGGLGRDDKGRSDTTMIVTINPKKKTTTITSIDRDFLVEIVGKERHDKLNSAYSYGGVQMTIDTLENFLDVPINHYATINLQGLEDLIDAVDGIEVDNKIDFTLDGIHVPKGKITLDGEKGLAYARMRKDDSTGDMGRQERQREVLTKVVKKLASVNTVKYYTKVLEALGDNVTTDLTWNQMLDIATNYQAALTKIVSIQIGGQGYMINDGYYQIPPYYGTLEASNQLREQLGLADNAVLSLVKDEEQRLYDDSYVEPDAGWDDATRTSNVYFGPYFEGFSSTRPTQESTEGSQSETTTTDTSTSEDYDTETAGNE